MVWGREGAGDVGLTHSFGGGGGGARGARQSVCRAARRGEANKQKIMTNTWWAFQNDYKNKYTRTEKLQSSIFFLVRPPLPSHIKRYLLGMGIMIAKKFLLSSI